MKHILNKEISDKLANLIILGCVALVVVVGFLYQQQREEVEKLELRLERNYHLQERAVALMERENVLDYFMNLEDLSEEQIETVERIAEKLREKDEDILEEETEEDQEEEEEETED